MSVTNNCSNTTDSGRLDRVLEGTEVMGQVERKENVHSTERNPKNT